MASEVNIALKCSAYPGTWIITCGLATKPKNPSMPRGHRRLIVRSFKRNAGRRVKADGAAFLGVPDVRARATGALLPLFPTWRRARCQFGS